MKNLLIPSGYCPTLDVKQTEKAIKLIKDFFEVSLAAVEPRDRPFVRPARDRHQ
jgi:hypothetical protein